MLNEVKLKLSLLVLLFLCANVYGQQTQPDVADAPQSPAEKRYAEQLAVLTAYEKAFDYVYESNPSLFTDADWKEIAMRFGYAATELNTVAYSEALCIPYGQSYCSDADKTMDMVKYEIEKLKVYYDKASDYAKENTGIHP